MKKPLIKILTADELMAALKACEAEVKAEMEAWRKSAIVKRETLDILFTI